MLIIMLIPLDLNHVWEKEREGLRGRVRSKWGFPVFRFFVVSLFRRSGVEVRFDWCLVDAIR